MRFVKGFALNCHSDACRGSELSLHKQLENYEVRSTRLLYFIIRVPGGPNFFVLFYNFLSGLKVKRKKVKKPWHTSYTSAVVKSLNSAARDPSSNPRAGTIFYFLYITAGFQNKLIVTTSITISFFSSLSVF